MSSCAFTNFLQMRGYGKGPAVAAGPAAVPSSSSSSSSPFGSAVVSAGPVAAALQHHAPALSALDVGSPHKRQRNKSPDSSAPAQQEHELQHHDALSVISVDAAVGYFGAFALPSSDVDSSATVTPVSPSPVCPLKSILCAPSSPSSTVPSSPCTSPPVSRPVSRRSSTSKSVRFARCTNASVFPTHSTTEYDRSPIVPTCEAQSLEIKRCKNDDEDGEWVQCQAREKAAAAAAGARLPKHSPAMENPVEGVHGLIEGSYFVGEERDDPAFPSPTPPCGSLGVAVVPPAIPEAEDDLALDDDDVDFAALDHGVGGDGELMFVDDSAENDEAQQQHDAHRYGDSVPHLVRSDSSDEASSSSEECGASSSSVGGMRSSSPEGSVSGAEGASTAASSVGSVDEHGQQCGPAAERCAAEKKKKFGLCALGKWTRQDLFHSTDSLGGF
ncbi:hypothetical protein JCM3775_004085 [Rhodotorula graminis]